MQICVIGTGYVGLVAGTCLADMGNDVVCVDTDTDKIKQLNNGVVPIYEPGLEELIKSNVTDNRLSFSTDLDSAVRNAQVCFIAVGTPQSEDGSADLSCVWDVAESIAKSMNGYKVIVNKSTVPVGTAEKVETIIKKYYSGDFDVVSNPEFLKQGAAVEDFLKPDRIVIGSNSSKATAVMQELYASFFRTASRFVIMDVKSAEMTKYAANSFLALKISFANEIANLCEVLGADAEMVRNGMCSDKRIGTQFFFPGLGYGGSCFPKDVKALLKTAKDCGCEHRILDAINEVNKAQRFVFLNKILERFGTDLSGKTFAVWGLAFKPKTNDMRVAPAITIINELLKRGAQVRAFDPKAMDSAISLWGEKIYYAQNSYDALDGADAMLLLTEWNEFRRPDFDRMKLLLKTPVIFDGRNQYEADRMFQRGFEYYCIGRNFKKISA